MKNLFQVSILKELQYKERRLHGRDTRLKEEIEEGLDINQQDQQQSEQQQQPESPKGRKKGRNKAKKENGEQQQQQPQQNGEQQQQQKQPKPSAKDRKKKKAEDDAKNDAGNASSEGKKQRNGTKDNNSKSIFINRIPRNAKARDLREALGSTLGLEVNPSSGLVLSWKGQRGFALRHLGQRQRVRRLGSPCFRLFDRSRERFTFFRQFRRDCSRFFQFRF